MSENKTIDSALPIYTQIQLIGNMVHVQFSFSDPSLQSSAATKTAILAFIADYEKHLFASLAPSGMVALVEMAELGYVKSSTLQERSVLATTDLKIMLESATEDMKARDIALPPDVSVALSEAHRTNQIKLQSFGFPASDA